MSKPINGYDNWISRPLNQEAGLFTSTVVAVYPSTFTVSPAFSFTSVPPWTVNTLVICRLIRSSSLEPELIFKRNAPQFEDPAPKNIEASNLYIPATGAVKTALDVLNAEPMFQSAVVGL